MPRPSNTEQRRSQITQGLMQVMAERGYDGASIADIARAAELSPGLVHYHFQNKREILLALLDEMSARHDQKLNQRLQNTDDPAQSLAEFLYFHLGTGRDSDPQALKCWILLSAEALRDVEVSRAFERVLAGLLQRLRTILLSGVEQAIFRCESKSTSATAAALLSLIQGYFVLAATARELIPRGSAALSACRMAEGLLASRRPISKELSVEADQLGSRPAQPGFKATAKPRARGSRSRKGRA